MAGGQAGDRQHPLPLTARPRYRATLAFLVAAALVGFAILVLLTRIQPYLAWLGTWSIATFAAYAIDKSQARRHSWRLPENSLHGLAVAGGVNRRLGRDARTAPQDTPSGLRGDPRDRADGTGHHRDQAARLTRTTAAAGGGARKARAPQSGPGTIERCPSSRPPASPSAIRPSVTALDGLTSSSSRDHRARRRQRGGQEHARSGSCSGCSADLGRSEGAGPRRPDERARIRQFVGYMPEHDCLPPDVSATEFVVAHGADVRAADAPPRASAPRTRCATSACTRSDTARSAATRPA